MAKLLKLRRGTTTQHASFTGAEGEVTVDITKDTAVVHDGNNAGGTPLAKEDMSNVSSASIAGQLGANSIDVSKVSGLALDKIYEGDSKVEVVDSGTGYVTTEVDGTEIQRHAGGASTVKYLRVGANWNMSDPSAAGSAGIAIGDAGNSHDFIAGSQTNGLAIQSNYGISIKQAGFPNQTYAGFNTAGCNFFVGGNTKLQVHSTAVETYLPFLPNVDSNTDLGSSTKRWQNIYTDAANVAGNITVTGSVDGRDVSDDGTKLDGIESGATADQTAAEIRTLVESASDSNVFTDADHSKLNGIESGATADQTGSQINALLSSELITCSGLDAANEIIRTDAWFYNDQSGNGLYNSATTQHFYSDDDDYWNIAGGGSANGLRFRDEHAGTLRGYVYANASSQIGFLSSTGAWSLKCDNSGNVTATGNVTAYSDARLKTDIHTINDALSICGKLRGVSYKWIKDGKASIGVIAQEVEEVLPEVVLTQQVLDPTGEREVKSVDYGKIVGVLINAINELKAEVDELKGGK